MSYDPNRLPPTRPMNVPPQYPPAQPYQPPYLPGPSQPQQYGQAAPPTQYGQPYGAPPPFMPPQLPPRPKKRALPFIVAGIAVVAIGLCAIGALASNSSSGTKTSVDQPAVNAAGNTAAGKTAAAAKPKQPATFNVPVGSTLTVSDDGGDTVKATLQSVKIFKKACNDYAPAPDNGMFVVVDVVVEQTAGTGSVNPLDFTYVAGDGTTANALSAAFSGCDEPSLDSSNSLQAGQKRAGKIAFDTDSGSGTLEWAPGGLAADAVGSWKVSG